jgi:uncharacterized repeat protein (TIGR04076 family)
MFKVRIKLVAFLGNQEKYPCHMQHKVGDEVIFDGERYEGRLCPDVWPLVAPKVNALYQAGPRYVEPAHYYPFWYAPPSVDDESKKVYDGLGYRPMLTTHVEPQYHMANLAPPGAFRWPPQAPGTVMKEVGIACPDPRTIAVFALEAFDLADKGYAVPFFRRQMTILDRVSKHQGTAEKDLLCVFSLKEREEIYPPLVPEILPSLTDELMLMGYLERKDGALFITEKGVLKIGEFRKTLTDAERKALEMETAPFELSRS